MTGNGLYKALIVNVAAPNSVIMYGLELVVCGLLAPW